MKKLFLSLTLLIAITATSFAGPVITISIELGHKDPMGVCIPRGICRISVGGTMAISGTINDNTGNLEVAFAKIASQMGNYDTQFVNGIFDVPVAYTLPADVCAKLGVSNYTIKAGKYKYTETGNQYSVVFTSSASK